MSIIKVACVGKSNDELHHRCLLLSRGLLQFIKLGSSDGSIPRGTACGYLAVACTVGGHCKKEKFPLVHKRKRTARWDCNVLGKVKA